jgi:hypothetical protein
MPETDITPAVEQVDDKVDSQDVPVDEQTAVPESPEAASTPEAEVAQTEPPKVEETPQSWDPDEPNTPKTTYDFSQLGGALGLEDIKSEEDVVTKFKNQQQRIAELESKPFEAIPMEFRDIIQAAKTGGQWQELVSLQTTDFSKLDPLRLYSEEFDRKAVEDPRFYIDGKLDNDAIDAAWAALPQGFIEDQGNRIKQDLIDRQSRRRNELIAASESVKAQADQNLLKAAQSLNEVLPLSQYGITFEPKHTQSIYQGITSSALTKKHLGVTYEQLVQSGADLKAAVRTITLAEKAEAMLKHKSKDVKTETRKEILEKTQNVQLSQPGAPVEPVTDKKPLSTREMIEYTMKQQKKGWL